MLTPDDRQRLAEMRQAAAQATPWRFLWRALASQATYGLSSTAPDTVLWRAPRLEDAAHIASASPDRVLWLLDLVERMAGPGWKDAYKLCVCGHTLLIHQHTEPHRCKVEGCACEAWSESPPRLPVASPRCSICRSDDCRQDHACE
jgi:hypothetical protein